MKKRNTFTILCCKRSVYIRGPTQFTPVLFKVNCRYIQKNICMCFLLWLLLPLPENAETMNTEICVRICVSIWSLSETCASVLLRMSQFLSRTQKPCISLYSAYEHTDFSFSFWIISSRTHSQKNFWFSSETGSMTPILWLASWAFRKSPAWHQLSMRHVSVWLVNAKTIIVRLRLHIAQDLSWWNTDMSQFLCS